jgi:2-dehydropantoate 2-reductase
MDASRAQSVAVIGAGGVGSVVAAQLVQAGHDVTLCARRAVDRLVVETPSATRTLAVRSTADPDAVEPVDWVLLATKGHQTAGALPWLTALVGERTVVAVLQNGIDHAERLRALGVEAEVLPVLVTLYAEGVAPGHVRHVKGDRLAVPAGATGARFAELFAGGAIEVVAEADFRTAAWHKLLGNVAANPVTALTGRRGAVLHDEDVLALCAAVMAECVTVARAEGAALGDAHVAELLAVFRAFPPQGGTSMLWDRLAGRPLEHELLTGAVVRAGRGQGVPTPRNDALLALLRAVSGAGAPPG